MPATTECTAVHAGDGEQVWTVAVASTGKKGTKNNPQMRSTVFFTPSFVDTEPRSLADTYTPVRSLHVTPSGGLFLVDGVRVWRKDATANMETKQFTDRAIHAVWGTGNSVWVVGGRGLVGRWDGAAWTEMSIPEPIDLHRIHGASARRFFVVGDAGALWRYDGAWTRLTSGTDARLYGVLDDGERVHGCGERSTYFTHDGTDARAHAAPADRTFRAVTRFQDRIYLGAGEHGVDRVEGAEVIAFKSTIRGECLSASAKYLWSCGGEKIFRFDGSGWLAKQFD
jgi:hypothetical protein